jgi:hypothetical protein
VLALVGQMPQLGWAIIAVVIVNGAFSFVQEYRAERATRALAALLPEEATALTGVVGRSGASTGSRRGPGGGRARACRAGYRRAGAVARGRRPGR